MEVCAPRVSVPRRRACQGEDGRDDLKKGTQLLEVYALEIQMHTELKNTKRLKELYSRALTIKSAIPHPRIMGIIRECGGKMHMHERVWSEAATDFFEVPATSCTYLPPSSLGQIYLSTRVLWGDEAVSNLTASAMTVLLTRPYVIS